DRAFVSQAAELALDRKRAAALGAHARLTAVGRAWSEVVRELEAALVAAVQAGGAGPLPSGDRSAKPPPHGRSLALRRYGVSCPNEARTPSRRGLGGRSATCSLGWRRCRRGRPAGWRPCPG